MKNILFVCTGNTCRSPMAEFIMKDILKNGEAEGDVRSAGVYASCGDGMSTGAANALKILGIPYKEDFQSHSVTIDMLLNADCVITMTESHRQYLLSSPVYYYASTAGKIPEIMSSRMITGEDIPDPYGQGTEAYMKAADRIIKLCGAVYDRYFKEQKK